MRFVLNNQLPADLNMTDTHLLAIAEEMNSLFSGSDCNTRSTIFIEKRFADRCRLVDEYRVTIENRYSATNLTEWANAVSTQIALHAMHDLVGTLNL